jgi:hypothetical protein
MPSFELSPGSVVGPALSWLNIHYHFVFAGISIFFEFLVNAIISLLSLGPATVVAAVIALGAGLAAGWRVGILAAAGLYMCLGLDMWDATLQTIAHGRSRRRCRAGRQTTRSHDRSAGRPARRRSAGRGQGDRHLPYRRFHPVGRRSGRPVSGHPRP